MTSVAPDGAPGSPAPGVTPNDASTQRLDPRAGIPERMGTYMLGDRLGGGGMGVVFNALDESLNREAAVKVIHPQIASNAEHFARLKREAQSSAMLSHRHIVSVYAFGVERGFPYIAMEKLKGHDLEQIVIREGPVRPERAVRYMREAAEALGFAAASGIIHRDIKPSNLFLTDRGEIKVMDFGLARQAGSETNLTMTGMVMGTPGYMSPEQARGQSDLDARTDIFSLGCTMYALLRGERPMSDKTPMEAMINMATQPIGIPKEWRSIAGGRVFRILERMTATDRNVRYANWDEVAADLADAELVLLGGSGGGSGTKSGSRSGAGTSPAVWRIIAAASVAVAVVVALVLVAPMFRSQPASAGSASGPTVGGASGSGSSPDSSAAGPTTDPALVVNTVDPENPPVTRTETIEVAGAVREEPRSRPEPRGTGRAAAPPPPLPRPPFAPDDPPPGDPVGAMSRFLGGGLMEMRHNATEIQQALWVGDWQRAAEILEGLPSPSAGHGEEKIDVAYALRYAEAFELKHEMNYPATAEYREKRAERAALILDNIDSSTPFDEALAAAIYLALLGVPDLEKVDDRLAENYPRGRAYDDGIRRVHSVQIFVYEVQPWYPGMSAPPHERGGGPQGGGGRFGGPPGGGQPGGGPSGGGRFGGGPPGGGGRGQPGLPPR